jgi:hypothetical protein
MGSYNPLVLDNAGTLEASAQHRLHLDHTHRLCGMWESNNLMTRCHSEMYLHPPACYSKLAANIPQHTYHCLQSPLAMMPDLPVDIKQILVIKNL